MSKNSIRVLVGVTVAYAGLLFPGVSSGERRLPPIPVTTPKAAPTVSAKNKGKTGLIIKKDGVGAGYVTIATKEHPAVYLIDTDGHIVHEWNQSRKTSLSVYLLPNGNLLRTVRSLDGEVGDYVEELTWDGELVWEYKTDRSTKRIHHDIERLPNGNTLICVWERKDEADYLSKGRNPETVANNELWVDAVYEIKPTGTSGGEVVWRWSPWDHLIQNFDESKENYGNPAEHPQRIDVNQVRTSADFVKLSDWLHVNSVSYNAERDEILLSVHALSEMWVVSRKKNELIYRWGNPGRYGSGTSDDEMLFSQHDIHVIPDGLRGAGNILIFNNEAGSGRKEGRYSSVLELTPPLSESGEWPAVTEEGFPPCKVVWEFSGGSKGKFYSKVVSNTQRLENGNTLICVGAKGLILEVDQEENVLWFYMNPVFREGPPMKKLEKWNSGPPPGGNLMFRAYKYPPEYPAFIGKDLSPKELLISVVPDAENTAE